MKHRFTLLFALLCASMMSFAAIDWSAYEWLGNGSGNEAYTSKIKVAAAEGQSVVNLQKPGWAAEAGIYTYFGAGIQSCSLPEGKYAIDGAGICLYLSAFTAKETEVTIVDATKTYVFTVYYEDGVAGGAGGEGTDPTPKPEPEPGVIDWSSISWLGNGIGPAEYTDKYKAVVTPVLPGTGINNLQPNGGQNCIHIAFPSAAFGTISLGNTQYHIEGAGMFVHLDAFTQQYTEFTVVCEGITYTFTVYYADGQEGSVVMVPEIYDVNFALASNGSTATASSGNADLAIDGNEGTRWESAQTDDETYTLDMGQLRVFNTVKIKWEGAYCSQFELTYSTDGVAYQPLYTETALASAGWQEIYFEAPVTAQYIKYHGTKRATGYGQSFYEFQVLLQEGAPMENIAVGKSIYASSTGNNDASRVVDGNGGTEWQGSATNGTTGDEAARTYDAWFVVDLGAYYDIAKVSIVFEGACSQAYHVDFSADANTWKQVFEHNGNAGVNGHTKDIKFTVDNKKVRYIRFWSTKAATEWGMKIFEFQVFGTPAATPTKPVSASVNDAAMGSATVTQGGEDVTEVVTGTEVTFSAVANDGYVFVEWSNGEKNATFTTTVDAALNLTATFRKLGTTYCNTLVQSTNGGQEHDAYVTMKRTAENEYTLVVRSAEAMLNFGGVNFYMQPNTHVIDLRNQGTLSADKRTLIATFSAEKEPYMTDPLFVVLDGGFEARFPQLTNIEYTVSCEDPEITAMVLNHSTAVLETGNTITLEPIFTPTFMSADITWETSNADVATVSNGIVTAIGAGEATITAKVSETIKATCIITVQTATAHNWYGYATDQELDYTYRIEYTIDHHIVAHVKRQGEKVGLVDASMLIGDKWTDINNTEGEEEGWKKGVTEQTYTIGEELNILIQSNYAGGSSKIYVNYIVGSDNTMPTIEPSQLSLNTNSLTMGVSDEDIQLVAEIHHCDAANKTLTWTSSNEAAVTVVDGKVHPVAVGTATITATTHNGISATCEVTVVGALEAATWYGVTTIQVNGNPVGVNYNITRTSDRKLQFYYSLAESIEELGNTSVVFKGTPETWNTMMKLDANERTAEFTSESTYIDGSTIGIFFYLQFAGGAGRWDVDYIVGSSNEKPNTLVAFGDQADNTAKIAEYADEVVDAYINRTFPNTDEWYTLCLPFDMDEAQLAATFGAGYTLATLGNSEDRGSLIHLNFNYVNTLEAGKPYLLKPGVSTATVPMIEDVTIKNVDPSAAPQKAESAHMHFQGTFAPTTLEGDNKRFVGPNNYLYSPAEGGTNMKSFRCYFTIPVESQALVGSKAARIVLGPQVATGTENVQSDQVQSTKVIIDGTLYIIRDGRTYNAQGQLVK